MRRALITGIGAITPVGLTAKESWRNLLAGVSGIGPIEAFDPSDLSVRIAGEVKGFQPDRIDLKAARRMSRFAQLSVAAAFEAAEESWQRPSSKKDDLDGSHTRRRLFGVLAAAVYGYSLVDVLVLSGGEEPQAAGSVSVVPMVDTRATGVAVVVRF